MSLLLLSQLHAMYIAHAYLVMKFFSFTLLTSVHGYHVYQDNWGPNIGDHLV